MTRRLSNRFRPVVSALEAREVPAAIGALDTTFGTAGKVTLNLGATDVLNAVAVQADGKIVVAGASGDDGGDFLIARLNTDGSLDTTFGQGGVRYIDFGGNDVATGVLLQSDGKIVAGGYAGRSNNSSDFAAVRLNADGSDDATFGLRTFHPGTTGSVAKAYTIASNQFGNIYLAGSTGSDIAVARLDPFGNLDRSFGSGNGISVIDLGGTEVARGLSVIPNDNRILVSGSSTAGSPSGLNNFVAMRLSPDGTQTDFGFGTNEFVVGGVTRKAAVIDLGGDDISYAATMQPNGYLLMAGSDGGVGSDFAVVRLDLNGQPDSNFNGNGIRIIPFGGTDVAQALTLQSDGRIVLAGWTTPDRSTIADFASIRLNSDGSNDSSYGGTRTIDFGGDDRAYGVALTPQSKIVLVGQSVSDSAAGRVIGSLGLPTPVLVSGTPDGNGKIYQVNNGQYVGGASFNVFPGFSGNIRVAMADVTGDGVPDRIAGAGPGGGPVVTVYDGKTGTLLASFFAFEPTFTGGVLVAAGDFNNDGKADVIVTPDVGGGPRVRIFNGADLIANRQSLLADFLGINDPNFRGGARAAAGDVNNDGFTDLIIAAGVGGGPRIAIYNGKTVATQPIPTSLVPDFFAFEQNLRNGAYVTSGDVDGDGFDDLIFGAGPGGSARVRIISGKQLIAAGPITSVDSVVGLQIASFIAGDPNLRGGVTVTARDFDGDGNADIVTGSGQNEVSQVRLYKGKTILANGGNSSPDQIIDPFNAVIAAGVFVG